MLQTIFASLQITFLNLLFTNFGESGRQTKLILNLFIPFDDQIIWFDPYQTYLCYSTVTVEPISKHNCRM